MLRISASLTLLGLAACGGDGPAIVDARSVDATEQDAGAEATVTVRVRRPDHSGAPDPSAIVFFVDPDGTIASQRQPDASGTAIGTMRSGGSVTVGWPELLLATTIFGVDDGDDLAFGPDDDVYDQSVTVELPTLPGATSYALVGPCINGNATSTTVVGRFTRACGPTRRLLAQARNAAGLHYLLAPTFTPVDGATIAVSGTWAPATSATVDFVGFPATARLQYIDRYLYSGDFSAHLAGAGMPQIVNGATTATFVAPTGFGDAVAVALRYGDAVAASEYLALVFHPVSDPAPIDVAPAIPDVVATTQTGRTVGWTLSGTGAFDAVVINAGSAARGDGVVPSWLVIAPPTASEVTLPVLPPPFDFPVRFGRLQLIESSIYPGYAEAKRRAGTNNWEPRPVPSDGRVLVRSR